MNIPPVKICFPEQEITKLKSAFEQILKSGILTSGKYVDEFEKNFANYMGIKYAIAVNSGTSAIEIPLRIYGIENKNVIVPTNTFFATPAAVIHAGGKVKFADADPQTFCISKESIEKNIDKDTIGVIVVHIGGVIPPYINEIKEICEENGLFLFEDCAHSHGSKLNGDMAGTFGDASSFSFFPTKLMTSGEGGMIVSNDLNIDKRARVFRNQGMSWEVGNINVEMGYNWRISEFHAAIGLSQLKFLDEFIEQRRRIAKIYDSRLKKVNGLEPLKLNKNLRHGYYKYIVKLDPEIDRDYIKKELKENYGVSLSGEVYDRPCHLQPVFHFLGYREGDFPVSESICKQHICLPIYPYMEEWEANYVVDSLREVI
jgi:dTDP-4-amino-4,6-dideoxygalactose transaminase